MQQMTFSLSLSLSLSQFSPHHSTHVMFWLVVKRVEQCVYEKRVSMYLYSFGIGGGLGAI